MVNKVLIAGGAGFLGSYLCDHYLKNGWEVDCLDNLSTSSGVNIRHLKSSRNFNFFKSDITKHLPKSVQEAKYKLVINMASPASPPHYQRLAIETLQAGSQGTLNLLDIACKNKARFFHASTSEVYGDPEVHPQPETYWGKVHSYGPRSMYDESKRYAEALIYTYCKKYGVNTVIARFFNTYGPRMDALDGRVVSNLIVQALKNQPLTIYGDGSQTRSFCFVEDLIRGIVALIESGEEGPINLGNPGEFNIKELARMILEKTGSESTINHLPLPGDDPLQRKPDISLAKEKLGWEPKIKLDKGLDKTIEFFRTEIKNRHTTGRLKTPKPLF